MTMNEELEPGVVIDGKYRVDSCIGTGGMGSVYLATQIPIGRIVAVKLLHEQCSKDFRVVKRFFREAQLAGSIGHDNICEVTDYGTCDTGAPYLVMPALKGSSLANVIQGNNGPLPIERLCDMVCQMLSALDSAHRAGIVHRDLKPDNIFITTVGDRTDFVKLLDFGISKVLESDTVSQLTQTGMAVGTPHYMAPEQARGDKDIDQRLDIYAVGVIMYEALTQRRPHEGDSYNEVMFKIISEPLVPPRRINAAIPEPLEQIVLCAMQKEPTARYAHASDMQNEIKRVMAAEETDTVLRGESTGPTDENANETGKKNSKTVSRQTKKISILLIAGVVMGVLVGAILGWLFFFTAKAPVAKVLPPQQPILKGSRPAIPIAVSPENPGSQQQPETTDDTLLHEKKTFLLEKKNAQNRRPRKHDIHSISNDTKHDAVNSIEKKPVMGRRGTTFVGIDEYPE